MCLGVPGQIVAITHPEYQLAQVDISGVQREVSLACIVTDDQPLETYVGDWVLVHVGFAMSRIDPQEAAATLQMLREMGEMQAEEF